MDAAEHSSLAAGVDLGSANARVAVAQVAQVSLLAMSGGRLCGSAAISFCDGKVVLGARAAARAATHPHETVLHPLKLLGTPTVLFAGAQRDPAELVSWWLRQAANMVAHYTGHAPQMISACLPSRIRDRVKSGLELAAAKAGLHLGPCVSPTTAAAFDYIVRNRLTEGLIAVADVGAENVEAAIVSVAGDTITVLARSSAAPIGGAWLDHRVLEAFMLDMAPDIAIEQFDAGTKALLLASCEALRCELSEAPVAVLNTGPLAASLGRSESCDWQLNRDRLDALAAPLEHSLDELCKRVITQSNASRIEIKTVLAVGGVARMPLVSRALAKAFGRAPVTHTDWDIAAARGVALVQSCALGTLEMVIEELVRSADAPADSVLIQAAANPAQVIMPPMPGPVSSVPAGPPESEPRSAPPGSLGSILEAQRVASLSQQLSTVRVHQTGSVDWGMPVAPLSGYPQAPLGAASEPPASVATPSSVRAASMSGLWPSAAFAAQAQRASAPPSAQPSALPLSGTFFNAKTPELMRQLPLTRALGPQDINPIALPILLLHLGRNRSLTGVLQLEGGSELVRAEITGGGMLAPSAKEIDRVISAFTWESGTYAFKAGPLVVPGADKPRVEPKRESLAKIAVEGLRSLLRLLPDGQVEMSLADKVLKAPKISNKGVSMAESLGFWQGEKRFLKYRCDGSLSGMDALRSSGLSRAAGVQVLFVIDLLGEMNWQPVASAAQSLAGQLQEQASRASRGNYFEVLAVHWSAPEDEIELAYHRLASELGPGSESSRVAPEAVRTILTKAREAHAMLRNLDSRMRYLAKVHPDLQFGFLADLLHKRAVALEMKGEKKEAMDSERIRGKVGMLERPVARMTGGKSSPPSAPPKKPG